MPRSQTTTLANGIKMQVAFDFVTLSLGNGRTLTCGRSGEKASGDVPDNVFTSLTKLVDNRSKDGRTLDVQMGEWAEQTLPSLWPEWNVAPVEPTLGMKVRKDNGKGTASWRGVHVGEVVKLASRKGGRHTVKFPFGNMAMTSGEIALCEVVG